MIASKANIIAQLRRDILPLQRYQTALKNTALDEKLGAIKNAFPGNTFPLAAIHEFISITPEDGAVTGGFVAGILASLMHEGGVIIWIGASKKIFLPAFKSFGIAPDRIIFIDLKKEKEILWAMEEALKCEGLAAVVAQVDELNFTASRRLQLAVEKSKVTGFVLRQNPRQVNTTACFTRWKITSLPSRQEADMPGVGFPRWNVALLKVRNGQPGNWQIELIATRFRHLYTIPSIIPIPKKKTG